MSPTKDNDKKPVDNNAVNAKKNRQNQKNLQTGKKAYSKEVDHL